VVAFVDLAGKHFIALTVAYHLSWDVVRWIFKGMRGRTWWSIITEKTWSYPEVTKIEACDCCWCKGHVL